MNHILIEIIVFADNNGLIWIGLLEKLIGDYYKSTRAKNCPEERIIKTAKECEIASSNLKVTFQSLTDSEKKESTSYPAGCFWKTSFGDKSGFNPVVDLSKINLKPEMTLFGGICQSSGIFIKIVIRIHTSKNIKK